MEEETRMPIVDEAKKLVKERSEGAPEPVLSDKKDKKKPNKRTIVVLLVVFAVVAAAGAYFFNSIFNKPKILTTSQLEKIVTVSKLSSAQFVYNGIAEKVDDKDSSKVLYHISYEAMVTASANMDGIKFDVDNEAKTVTPILPEITVDDPVVDDTKIDFLPSDANVDLKEVLEICKADALNDVQQSGQIKKTAKENLKTTVEALLLPLLDSNGYKIDWKETSETDSTNNGVSSETSTSDASTTEGSNNEAN